MNRISRTEIVPLWVVHFYDRPLSGICLYDGMFCYFYIEADDPWGHARYTLHPLTDDEFIIENTAHRYFEDKIGTFWNLDENWQRSFRGGRKGSDEDYMANRPPRLDYKPVIEREPLGWFSRTPHRLRPRSERYWAKRDLTSETGGG